MFQTKEWLRAVTNLILIFAFKNSKPLITGKLASLQKVFRNNLFFLIPFALVICTALILLATFGNHKLFFLANNWYSSFFDLVFLYITHLGDGTVPFLLVFILLLVSFREALAFLSITLILIIIITVLKRVIFPEFDRPVEYFCDSPDIRIIKGYDPPRLYTFPSGHSSTVFSVFLYLAFLAKNKWMKFALFLVALSVSYSRIYLSAHFPADAVAGSLIAVSITLLFYTWSRNFKPLWLDKKIVIAPKFTIR